MSYTDLVFEAPSGTGGNDLVFGDFSDAVSLATLGAVLAPPTFAAQVQRLTAASLAVSIPGPTFAGTAQYSSGTQRPTVATTRAAWEEAVPAEAGATTGFGDTVQVLSGATTGFLAATPLPAGVQVPQQDAVRLRGALSSRWQNADRAGTGTQSRWQTLDRASRPSYRHRWQNAARVGTSTRAPFQSMLHDRRPTLRGHWDEAVARLRGLQQSFARGVPVRVGRDDPWQNAMRPPAGTSVPTPPKPTEDPCYIPSGDLVFLEGANASTSLLFWCERHDGNYIPGPTATVVVPIRSVYMITNTTSLRRVVGNIAIPTISMSLSLDVDSWAWGFSATLPGEALDAVQPTSTGPVELEAIVNGTAFRLLVESVSRDRAFGRNALRISGRGKAALLAAPYAPISTQTNDSVLDASQVALGLLSVNGVSLGWDVDWQIDDWSVPAGALQIQGTYMDGLAAVATAAGAFLRPHRVDQSISVISRYPELPRDWAAMTPDFELPSAVTVQEGITWTEKPEYNRVFVSGTSQGILGQVTLAGTAGDFVAPMVTDALITGIPAARQRAKAILGNTGRQADVKLRLPVLAETGVIQPGALVRYVDGGVTRLGLVRSTQVDTGFPEVWQTIGVETHVN